MSHPSRALIVALILAPGCLADNPDEFLETESGASGASASQSATDTSTSVDNLLGCEPDQTCNILLVSQTLDDRVEIFGGRTGDVPAYRGAIDLDLRPGTDPNSGLDEPYGLTLTDDFLHVVAGHYPTREQGTMVSFPTSFFAGRERGSTIASSEFFDGVGFKDVVTAQFAEAEPIFVMPEPIQGRLLIGAFNNNLFSTEDSWNVPGRLILVDPTNPSDFASVDLGSCLAAGEVVKLDDEFHVAVACDGDESVAFLELGTLDGPIDAAAASITATHCEIPHGAPRRVRHLAHDGAGGVFVGLGPSQLTDPGQVWHLNRNCMNPDIVEIGQAGRANLGNIVPFGTNGVLVASGSAAQDPVRGIVPITGTLTACPPIVGFEGFWETDGADIDPFGLAVAPDGTHLAVGAGAAANASPQDAVYGRVLWATLTGIDDPCTMTAEVVDLTDGTPGRAPKPNPADPTTTRQAPQVVVIREVSG